MVRWSVTYWLLQEDGKWVIAFALATWRAPYLYVSSEARKVGHGHDCSLLLLSLTFKINEGRSLMGGVIMCHTKLSSQGVKSWAALKKIHFLCGISLTPYFFSQNIFHLTSSCFLLVFWLLLLSLNFPRFSPSYPTLFYSFSLSISFLLSLRLSSCPYQLSSPFSFTCLHLRWSCDARGILFSLLWT